MEKRRHFLLLLLVLFSSLAISQTEELLGRVAGDENLENIHIINKTSQEFTITNSKGAFNVKAKLNDTLKVSSVLHKLKDIIISEEIMSSKVIFIQLEKQVNELDEVLVGKLLTGNLLSDIANVEGKAPLNFFDVGIPGYKGKPATQSERRLHEATTGGGFIPLNPILNAISGRTKMLKNRIKVEESDELMHGIKARLAKVFFTSHPLGEGLKTDFFYFCTEDENFSTYCKYKNDIEILEYLKMKYKQYNDNLNFTKN